MLLVLTRCLHWPHDSCYYQLILSIFHTCTLSWWLTVCSDVVIPVDISEFCPQTVHACTVKWLYVQTAWAAQWMWFIISVAIYFSDSVWFCDCFVFLFVISVYFILWFSQMLSCDHLRTLLSSMILFWNTVSVWYCVVLHVIHTDLGLWWLISWWLIGNTMGISCCVVSCVLQASSRRSLTCCSPTTRSGFALVLRWVERLTLLPPWVWVVWHDCWPVAKSN